jgi:hypothetical protein
MKWPVHATSGGAIFNIGRGCRARAVGTTIKVVADFHAMSDDPTVAMLADRRYRLDRTFEAVECVPDASRDELKCFVVLVATNFTFRHKAPPLEL